MRSAKTRVSHPAMAEQDELSLFVQLTVGVLSHQQQAATWTCFTVLPGARAPKSGEACPPFQDRSL
jgi:hypothetical protein